MMINIVITTGIQIYTVFSDSEKLFDFLSNSFPYIISVKYEMFLKMFFGHKLKPMGTL